VNHQDKVAIAGERLSQFLQSMTPPRGVTPEALIAITDAIADAFARKLTGSSEAEYLDAIQKTFIAVRDNHKGYTWPSQADFVAALPVLTTASAPQTYDPDDRLKQIGAKMAMNDGVPDAFVWGHRSAALMSGGYVTRDRMDQYRRGSVRAFKDLYKHDAMPVMQRYYGDAVLNYF
jgi:hypothetical protein